MTSRKLIAAAALLTLLTGVTQANAVVKKKAPPKPKPTCKLVTDGSSDATGTSTTASGPNDPSGDIVWADVASNATTLTVIWQLAAQDSPDPYSPGGHAYSFAFTAAGKSDKTVEAVVSKQGNGPNLPTTANVTVVGTQVHLSVALSELGLKNGWKLTNLAAKSFRWVGMTPVTFGVIDTAASNGSYVLGNPSCVSVGH